MQLILTLGCVVTCSERKKKISSAELYMHVMALVVTKTCTTLLFEQESYNTTINNCMSIWAWGQIHPTVFKYNCKYLVNINYKYKYFMYNVFQIQIQNLIQLL